MRRSAGKSVSQSLIEGQSGQCHSGYHFSSTRFHLCHDICIRSSHCIRLTLTDLLCGLCFVHSNSQKCYFCDLLPFGVYLTLPVLPCPLSNVLEFYFLHGPNLSSFSYLVQHLSRSPNMLHLQNLSFLFGKYVSEYDPFLFPMWSLVV